MAGIVDVRSGERERENTTVRPVIHLVGRHQATHSIFFFLFIIVFPPRAFFSNFILIKLFMESLSYLRSTWDRVRALATISIGESRIWNDLPARWLTGSGSLFNRIGMERDGDDEKHVGLGFDFSFFLFHFFVSRFIYGTLNWANTQILTLWPMFFSCQLACLIMTMTY